MTGSEDLTGLGLPSPRIREVKKEVRPGLPRSLADLMQSPEPAELPDSGNSKAPETGTAGRGIIH